VSTKFPCIAQKSILKGGVAKLHSWVVKCMLTNTQKTLLIPAVLTWTLRYKISVLCMNSITSRSSIQEV